MAVELYKGMYYEIREDQPGKFLPYRIGAPTGHHEGGRVWCDAHQCRMTVELMDIAFGQGVKSISNRINNFLKNGGKID